MVTAATDEECHALAEHIQKGLPNSRHELPLALRKFLLIKDELYCFDWVPIKTIKSSFRDNWKPFTLRIKGSM